jgi:hypothetical protein
MTRAYDRATQRMYRGVRWQKRSSQWRAAIGHTGKKHHLGTFTEREGAAGRTTELRRHDAGGLPQGGKGASTLLGSRGAGSCKGRAVHNAGALLDKPPANNAPCSHPREASLRRPATAPAGACFEQTHSTWLNPVDIVEIGF